MVWSIRLDATSFWNTVFALQSAPGLMVWYRGAPVAERSRYSYIGAWPARQFEAKSGQYWIDGKPVTLENPWAWLKMQLQAFSPAFDPSLPPFQGGVMGYWGYEFAHTLEQLPVVPDQIHVPDCVLYFYPVILAFDHEACASFLMATGFPETTPALAEAAARQQLAQWQAWLQASPSAETLLSPTSLIQGEVSSNFTQEAYQTAVESLIEAIAAGECFEANFTQQFRATLKPGLNHLDWFKRLTEMNPAPFHVLMKGPADQWLLSSSPECFVTIRQGQVQTEPIKGTIARSVDEALDALQQQALLASEKDRAEHMMIVDLMRNDLSRVCTPESVSVKALCVLKTFATVHHLVSEITGVLKAGVHAVDVLQATFPPGSVTGAPKVRAMEWISRLEQTTRGPYCGCMGYMSWQGDMETAVTIRTFVVNDLEVTWGAGGAVVLDSVPAVEYAESVLKGQRLQAVLRERS